VYFAITFVTVGRVPSVVEFWTGMPVVSGLLGLALAALLLPGAGAFAHAATRTNPTPNPTTDPVPAPVPTPQVPEARQR
jgi:hypothetical protein